VTLLPPYIVAVAVAVVGLVLAVVGLAVIVVGLIVTVIGLVVAVLGLVVAVYMWMRPVSVYVSRFALFTIQAYYYSHQIKENEIGRASSMHWRDYNVLV
jgi:hypothetical protein